MKYWISIVSNHQSTDYTVYGAEAAWNAWFKCKEFAEAVGADYCCLCDGYTSEILAICSVGEE